MPHLHGRQVFKIAYRFQEKPKHPTFIYLIDMLEKSKNTLDKGGFVCVIFMYLSKALDTMNHDLLIAKLGAYDFQKDALVFMESYFTNR